MELEMCYAFMWDICTNRAFHVSRTPETHLEVFLGAFLQSARRSLVVDFPLHQHASTCSSCPTTARRASCATNCATLSVWTQALSSPNSFASRQSSQESCVQQPGSSMRLSKPGLDSDQSEGINYTKGESWRIYTSSFFSIDNWRSSALLQPTPSHRRGCCFCNTI